ncbi:MAG TPA: RagB/SusD family nutrient uptake outer membrane protein [Petrimonas sp.]|uniref:RagB/SusD family nutrient uptake outer membrane protein n=1 Tax=Petrimonas sp. TaxID=2023866 RepID=UPI00096183E2|nr:RagB/SusD family nutrient uptake outer membrane protein [Petrimonas sp.]OJV38546.1 MAG: RagB/SusD family nutrient uptake outer membrane protein [Bacteroidia bacterium 43-41]HHV84420.1 RagB/SusD family nutrient uptake outer membrane protein [Petrimonas sp.]
MKKNYLFILIWGIGILMTSCDLNNLPLDSISPNTFFNTENDLKLYTNSFYNMLPSAEGVYNEKIDNIVSTDLSDELRGTRIVPTSGGGWSWNDLRNINYFLVNSHKCPDTKAVAKYNGVARFFRAYFYFEKVKRFGDVPWYSTPIEANDETLLTKKRDPRTVVMDSVLADINFAVANLETSAKINAVTKWTALALKSQICLYEGTFRKYHTEFNLPDADKFLDGAIAASDELMRTGPYKIFTDNTGKAYQNLFSSMDAIPTEIILARNFDDGLQVYHNLNYYTMTASYGRPGLEKKLVNSYLMKDGSRFTDIPGYEKMDFYEETQNRDPRLSQTIRTPGYTRIGENVHLVPEFGATVTGYQLIKFVTERKWDTYAKSANDMPIYRFAEVLLNFAEAKAERGTLTQADLDRSTKLIRDRIGMPNINLEHANANPDPYLAEIYPKVQGSNKGVILEIRRERRIELVMENFRWDDIIRWKEGPTLTKQFKGIYFPGLGEFDLDRDGTVDVILYEGDTKPNVKDVQLLKLNGDIVLENGNKGGNILINSHIHKKFDENKDYLYPIPISERLLNPNLTQNPGWDDGL